MDDRERTQFLADAERIGAEVAAMTDEQVQAYLVEHGLEDMVSDERVDEMLKKASVMARRNRFRVVK